MLELLLILLEKHTEKYIEIATNRFAVVLQ